MLKYIYNKFVKPSQVRIRSKIINSLNVNSVLDVGAGDGNLKEGLDSRIHYTGIDINPQSNSVLMRDIEDFNPKRKFDLVCCFAVLEHTLDPVNTIYRLKELSNKYILISVPYEPLFTISRFFIQEKEHYFVPLPRVLEYYLGKPILEKKIHLGREYMALYKK